MDSSLLAEFDPILRNTTVVPSTPKRTDTTNQDDALTLSAFFNRVNNVPPTEPPPPNNRGSLIDFSFNFGDIKSKIMKLSPAKKSAPKGATSSSTDAENIPPNTGATRLSPGKQRPHHPPASPFKSVRLLAETPKGLRGRRSSLDISQLTRDLKQTLGAENMSFDILKDEVSFLTNLGEEGVSILAKRQPVELSSNSSAARPLVPPSECGPTEAPRAPTKVSQAPTLEPSEVEFEAQPSSREAEAALQRPVTPTHSDHYAQQKRKSVFDMLESTPSSTSQASIPNIVTSWDDPPKRARASILAPKSRPLSGIRTSRMTSSVAASEATFKVPLPPQTESLTEGEPSEKASRTTRTEAEVTKRASGLRTVASSLINKDRSRPAKTGPSDPAPRTEEEKPASSTRTGGTLLRRSRSTLSSSTAAPVVAEKVAPRSRPTSVIIGKPRPSELQPTNAAGPMPSSLLSLLQRPPSQASQRASERGRAGGAGETATAAPESRRTQNRTSLIQSVSQRTTRPASPERKPRARVEEEAPKSRLQDWANDVAKASQQPESDGQGGCEASGPAATLARKTSVRDMATAGTLRRTKTSQSQLRREEPTSVARPGSPRKDGNSTVRSRVMERPALSGIKQWAADVASVAPRSEDVEVDEFAQLKSTSADAETIKGLTRKRSFKEPSATSAPLATGLSASTLRPTKTTISSTTTAPKPTEARPSGASKTATLRPRSSIYSIRDGKIAQSVDVLPLAQDSKPPPSAFQNGSTVRRRPSSMILYASKAGSMSTSAVNDVPSSMSGSQRTTTGATGAAGTASSRPSLLRRPSMTFAPPSSFAGPPPSASSAVAKGLSRVGSTLLRSSKSRPSMSTR